MLSSKDSVKGGNKEVSKKLWEGGIHVQYNQIKMSKSHGGETE